MIKLENIYKTYNLGKSNAFTALKGVNLTIDDGEMVAIIGKSGAGKSTLMHIIGCIDDFEKGTYKLADRDVSKISENKRANIRNSEIGIVLQDFALIEEYSAIENVMIPLYFSKNKAKKKERAKEALRKMGIEELADKRVNKLSGGQKQRVAIARAIVKKPAIILADEPTGNLDAKSSKEVVSLLKLSQRKYKQTLILVTHDDAIASQADRIITIEDGKIVGDTNEK